ncbi:MAG: FAD-linked oxidase C-terminal domain-containing protein [bacterium]
MRKLTELTAPERVIAEPERLACYARDESPGPSLPPDVAVLARDPEEIAGVLILARAERVPVTPRGLGTGLAGGSIAVQGGILLSTELMNEPPGVDPGNLVLMTRPGVTTDRVSKAAAAHGLYYPVDPASLEDCSIGGNIATNAGGARAFKHGVTAQYVRGLEAVTADGRIIHYGGRIHKNVTGYDLCAALVGSEGTLAVITEATLKLIPEPRYRVALLIPFERIGQGVELVLNVVRDARLLPAVVEFIERGGIRACNEVLGSDLPFPDAEVQVLIELEGNDRDKLLEDVVRLGEMAMELGASEPLVADNPTDQARIWRARRELAKTLKKVYPEVAAEDIVVPIAELPATVEFIAGLARRYAVTVIPFGHIGDGNIHVDICREGDRDDWLRARRALTEELMEFILGRGGQVSAEHGIGMEKRHWMTRAIGPAELEIMRALKRAWDPDGLLNPGKVLPD